MDLIPATQYPTSPGRSFFTGILFGFITPSSITSYFAPVFINSILSPTLTSPSNTRKTTTTPLYVSKYESKINALNGSSSTGTLGGGTNRTISSKISSIPIPAFAEHCTASVASNPKTSSISCATRSQSAAGKSILFKTGTISKSFSNAKYTFANVCASTP